MATNAGAEAQAAAPANKARQKVLTTIELLEGVLSFLPMKDLLFAQGVCKTWKTCIDNSPTLQKGLFFMPIGPPRAERLRLMANFETPAENREVYRGTYKNQVMWKLPSALLRAPHTGQEYTSGKESIDRPEASWRRMLTTQPPLPPVVKDKGVRYGDWIIVDFVECLFDELWHYAREWEVSRDLVY